MFNKTNLDFDAAKTVKDILDQLRKAIPSWSSSTPLLVDMWPWEHIWCGKSLAYVLLLLVNE